MPLASDRQPERRPKRTRTATAPLFSPVPDSWPASSAPSTPPRRPPRLRSRRSRGRRRRARLHRPRPPLDRRPRGSEGGEPFGDVFRAATPSPSTPPRPRSSRRAARPPPTPSASPDPAVAVPRSMTGRRGSDALEVRSRSSWTPSSASTATARSTVPGSLDVASAAVDALYRAADLEAAAPDSDRNDDGDLDTGSTTLRRHNGTLATAPARPSSSSLARPRPSRRKSWRAP